MVQGIIVCCSGGLHSNGSWHKILYMKGPEASVNDVEQTPWSSLPELVTNLNPYELFWVTVSSVPNPVVVTDVHGDETQATVAGEILRAAVDRQYELPSDQRDPGLHRLHIVRANPYAAMQRTRGVDAGNILLAYNKLHEYILEILAGARTSEHMQVLHAIRSLDYSQIETEQAMGTYPDDYFSPEHLTFGGLVHEGVLSYDALRALLVKDYLLWLYQDAYADFRDKVIAWEDAGSVGDRPQMLMPYVLEVHGSQSDQALVVISDQVTSFSLNCASAIARAIGGDVPILLQEGRAVEAFSHYRTWAQIELPSEDADLAKSGQRSLLEPATWSRIVRTLRALTNADTLLMRKATSDNLRRFVGVTEGTVINPAFVQPPVTFLSTEEIARLNDPLFMGGGGPNTEVYAKVPNPEAVRLADLCRSF